MRKRNVLGVGTAVALLAVAGMAVADPNPNEAGTAVGVTFDAPPGAVTLPTGDVVTVGHDGTVRLPSIAKDPDAGFWRLPARDGSHDAIIVPFTASDADVTASSIGRYNVSALLRAGYTDAAAAPVSALNDAGYHDAGDVAATEDTQTVTVTVTDHSGNAPTDSKLLWHSLDRDDFGAVPLDESGTGTVPLPRGEYELEIRGTSAPGDGAKGQVVAGYAAFDVSDQPVDVTVDGTQAEPVTAEVERPDAVLSSQRLVLSQPSENSGVNVFAGGDYDAYVLPDSGTPEPSAFGYDPVFTGVDESGPFTYNLQFSAMDGIPADLHFEARDAELAAVDTRFHSLGVDAEATTCEAGVRPEDQGVLNDGMCVNTPLEVPSVRTMYYTPGGSEWNSTAHIGEWPDGLTSSRPSRKHAVGAESEEHFRGPITPGFGGGVFRIAKGVGVGAAMIDNGGDELFGPGGQSGTVSLTDGETELGRYEGAFADFQGGFDLPADAAGRFTATIDMTNDQSMSAFATESSISWEFDCPAAPEDETAYLYPNLSGLTFDTDNIVDGYVDADAEQKVSLEYVPQPEAKDATAVDMALEVSYDDGANWSKIDIDRDGDAATANLTHPAGAKFVSVRLSATDDNGATFTSTTIRSYGLK